MYKIWKPLLMSLGLMAEPHMHVIAPMARLTECGIGDNFFRMVTNGNQEVLFEIYGKHLLVDSFSPEEAKSITPKRLEYLLKFDENCANREENFLEGCLVLDRFYVLQESGLVSVYEVRGRRKAELKFDFGPDIKNFVQTGYVFDLIAGCNYR